MRHSNFSHKLNWDINRANDAPFYKHQQLNYLPEKLFTYTLYIFFPYNQILIQDQTHA